MASFEDTLTKKGFRILYAPDIHHFTKFLAPEETIQCQSETQFINEALLVNSTGAYKGANAVYVNGWVSFYAITVDNRTNRALGYEYTPPLFRIP